ncbi:syntaxin binding protein 6 (amisyn), like [Hippocampus zosterae]|uniref:syntaxin binding protein 6 (amisyn), like n=1 Tax=Hippocampus zosterae TaxID=109293 RepID=UPI00223DAB4E|nr:syntaxin binding protein 6 (amisyn), like [Hippocampus zosterae]XP_051908176.1 syntaxin binding protein 6 (amisyn), like [Hippocampus zosterae]
MNIQSTINKEVFIPRNERMLVAVEVQRRIKKRISFFSPGSKGDYATFICVSVTNTRPNQLLISKVKQFSGSLAFTRTSQWAVEQLRQVNGINPNKDSPEFDLVFVNAVDQWVASSAAEKCILVQILYRACQTYWAGKAGSLVKAGRRGSHQDGGAGPMDSSPGPSSGTVKGRRKSYVAPRPPDFINCPSKLTGDSSSMNLFLYRCKAFFNHMKKKMVANQRSPENRVHQMKVALGERGHKLSAAEDKTVGLVHTAQQLADIAHKMALKHAK